MTGGMHDAGEAVADGMSPDPEVAAAGRRRVLVLTGLSGAGLSTSLKCLEDLGYEAIDNVPLKLLSALTEDGDPVKRPLAVVVDSRTRGFAVDAFLDQFAHLRARPDLAVRLVFIVADVDVLQRRFTETRRRHPLALDRPVADGIHYELGTLAPVRSVADLVIDTSLLATPDLRREINGHFQVAGHPGLLVFVTSFSYRAGLPREADLVFDVRFLQNPHWDLALRPLSGLDDAVARAVEADPDYRGFFDGLTRLIGPLLPRYAREGKSYLTIAVGCSGGRHRSVFVTEQLARWLGEAGVSVGLTHRDLVVD